MIRILIFIFALNAMALPASATVVCKMLDKSDSVLVGSSYVSSATQITMSCDMHDAESVCSAVQCVDSCATNITPIAFSNIEDFSLTLGLQPQVGFTFFYQLFLPVKTPPPLV